MYLIMPQSYEIRNFRKEQNKQHISFLTPISQIPETADSTKAFREPKYKFLRNRLIYLNSLLYWETSSTGE